MVTVCYSAKIISFATTSAELYNRKFQTSPTPRILSQAWIEPILLARQKANGHQKKSISRFLQISC